MICEWREGSKGRRRHTDTFPFQTTSLQTVALLFGIELVGFASWSRVLRVSRVVAHSLRRRSQVGKPVLNRLQLWFERWACNLRMGFLSVEPRPLQPIRAPKSAPHTKCAAADATSLRHRSAARTAGRTS
jgi:hypothetical protein